MNEKVDVLFKGSALSNGKELPAEPVEAIIEAIYNGSISDLERLARNKYVADGIRLPLLHLLNKKIKPSEAIENIKEYVKNRTAEIEEMEDGSRGWVYVR